jgi:serine/threonine-protein kinase
MGEVYRARDSKLNRDVALKVLPTIFVNDPDRMARFKREAQVLASLNHPNIAAIYGFEDSGDVKALVLELVEGPTLGEVISGSGLKAHGSGRPMAIADVLTVARQITAALEAAHDRTVVHRDLKPANVKITPEGVVKVLDFGLAKALEVPRGGPDDVTRSPTLSLAATQAGMILGTAAYMSPEQAKGAEADARSDVFSFGCVLYEMLTGRQAFQGDTVAETMAAVLMREPDLAALPPNLNLRLTDLLRRCLAKSPKARWQAVGDLRLELEAIAADPHGATVRTPAASRPLWKRAIPIAATAMIVGAAASALTWISARPTTPLNVTRLPVVLADGQQFTGVASRMLALSPDGTQVAYTANQQLFLRSLADFDAKPVLGTANQSPALPVFSPDGRWIAFYSIAEVSLKKIAATGGAPVTLHKLGQISTVGLFQSPSWSGDDILFVQQGKGILRVSANGGEPEVLVRVEGVETAYDQQLLPGGKAVLFSLATEEGADRWGKAQIVVQPPRRDPSRGSV